MNHEFTVRPATLATLPDVHALLPDPQDRERRTADTRQRIEDGRLSPEQFLLLRSARGVEGVAFMSRAPQVPVFPASRPDTPSEALTLLFSRLRDHDAGWKLLLDSTRTTATPDTALAAGWHWDAPPHLMYTTDLAARSYRSFSDVEEVHPHDPEVHRTLSALGQPNWEKREGWHLYALRSGAAVVALAGVGPSSRANWANMNMIGVLPVHRGLGYGQRLHEHLLARASQQYTHHGGGTEETNRPMRRIFERNGSVQAARQCYFRQP